MSLFQAIKRTVRPMPRGHLWHPCIETQLNFDILCRDYWRTTPSTKIAKRRSLSASPTLTGTSMTRHTSRTGTSSSESA